MAMPDEPTTVIIQRYLDALPEDAAAEPIVRELLERAAGRLRLLCATLPHKGYPRLTRPPANLEADELLGTSWPGCSRPCTRPAPRLCADSSRWPTSTCAGNSMTWPTAWTNGPPPRHWRNPPLR